MAKLAFGQGFVLCQRDDNVTLTKRNESSESPLQKSRDWILTPLRFCYKKKILCLFLYLHTWTNGVWSQSNFQKT